MVFALVAFSSFYVAMLPVFSLATACSKDARSVASICWTTFKSTSRRITSLDSSSNSMFLKKRRVIGYFIILSNLGMVFTTRDIMTLFGVTASTKIDGVWPILGRSDLLIKWVSITGSFSQYNSLLNGSYNLIGWELSIIVLTFRLLSDRLTTTNAISVITWLVIYKAINSLGIWYLYDTLKSKYHNHNYWLGEIDI